MAICKARGASHTVVYRYMAPDGRKQQWETYTTELEALQRKAYIDYLEKNNMQTELSNAAADYKSKRAAEKAAFEADKGKSPAIPEIIAPAEDDNTQKSYREFVEKWLPFHVRKNRLSPNTYDSYVGNLKNHILPYFGDWIMSTIKAEDIDNFIDHLNSKPCNGCKSYNKNPEEIPTLSSGTIKKCYNILNAGLPVAKKWKYITEIPATSAPAEKWKKRKAWEPGQVYTVLASITEDKLLHLAVHMAFVCSLRAGETAGIDCRTIDFHDRSMWITQEVQRVSDEALTVLPKDEIIKVFPKRIQSAKSSMILKGPKTEGSVRKQYLTTPLLVEIKERLEQIERNKEFFGEEYKDYGLLICQPDGRPIDPNHFDKWFKDWQDSMKIEEQIEFQGLRKSGQMHKVRLTQNNYQLVAENSGQSPEVLMSNYNEALESEKRTLALLVETNFYPQQDTPQSQQMPDDVDSIMQAIQSNPDLSRQVLQVLLSRAVHA